MDSFGEEFLGFYKNLVVEALLMFEEERKRRQTLEDEVAGEKERREALEDQVRKLTNIVLQMQSIGNRVVEALLMVEEEIKRRQALEDEIALEKEKRMELEDEVAGEKERREALEDQVRNLTNIVLQMQSNGRRDKQVRTSKKLKQKRKVAESGTPSEQLETIDDFVDKAMEIGIELYTSRTSPEQTQCC